MYLQGKQNKQRKESKEKKRNEQRKRKTKGKCTSGRRRQLTKVAGPRIRLLVAGHYQVAWLARHKQTVVVKGVEAGTDDGDG